MTIGKGAKLNFCHFPKGNLGRIIIFIIRPLFFSGAAQNNHGPAAMHFWCKSLWCDGHFLEINRAQRTNVKKRQKGMEKPDFAMTILQKKTCHACIEMCRRPMPMYDLGPRNWMHFQRSVSSLSAK